MILALDLSESGRQTLSILLILIHLISILCGAGLCTVGAFLHFSLQTKVHLIEGYDGNVLPIVLMVVGGLATLVNIVGGKLAFDIGTPLRRKRLRCLLLALVVLLLVVKLALFTAGIMCFAHRHHLSRSFHHGLVKAMGKYQEDHKLKHDLDLLQIQYRCCGNKGYEDWFGMQWVNNNFLDLQNSVVQSKMTSGQYLSDDVPFSCCRPRSPRPCIHHHVHDNAVHYRYDYQTDLTLHPAGCRDQLMAYFGSKLNKIGGAAMALLGLQTIAVLLARYLQTSISTAIDGGDPEMSSPGYLCPGGNDGSTGKATPGAGHQTDLPRGEDRVARTGSMDDYQAHDLDIEDNDDSFFDDSTFDDDFEEPIYENITEPSRDYEPIYENITEPVRGYDQYQQDVEEPIYANVPESMEMTNEYNREVSYDSEPIYANIPSFADTNIPSFADTNIASFAESKIREQMSRRPPQKPTAPPPQRPTGPPPQRPSQPPSQRPKGPKPPRPSGPPPQRAGRPAATSKKGPPPRPANPPTKRVNQSTPKTSTPKKAQAKQSFKSKKSSPRPGRSSSPAKTGKGKKSKVKTKSSPRSKPTGKKIKPKSRMSAPSAKSRKPKQKKRVKSKSPKRSPRTKKIKTKSVKQRSPNRSSKRTSGKRKMKSRNRNNNIIDSPDSASWDESESESTSSEETSSDVTTSSVESYDFESGSSSTLDESDASSDTPLLR